MLGQAYREVQRACISRMPERLDEEELADWRAGCNAVYQLAALTMPGPRRSVLLGLRHALARILKALHLTGSEPQSRMWRDGNSYSAAKDHTILGRAVPCQLWPENAARLSRIDWLSSTKRA